MVELAGPAGGWSRVEKAGGWRKLEIYSIGRGWQGLINRYCLEELRKNFTRFLLQPPDIFVKMFFYDGGRAWRDEENKMKFN
jgi:hypothetical protein